MCAGKAAIMPAEYRVAMVLLWMRGMNRISIIAILCIKYIPEINPFLSESNCLVSSDSVSRMYCGEAVKENPEGGVPSNDMRPTQNLPFLTKSGNIPLGP